MKRVLNIAVMALLTACQGATPPSVDEVLPAKGQVHDVELSLAANLAQITLGQTLQLQWLAQNADACVASGHWTGARATSGLESIAPPATGLYQFALRCTGKGAPAERSVAVTVINLPVEPDPNEQATATFQSLRTLEEGCCNSTATP